MCRTNYSESHLFRLLRDQKTPLDWTLTKHPDLQFALRLSAVWEPRHQFLPTLVKSQHLHQLVRASLLGQVSLLGRAHPGVRECRFPH